MHAPLCYLLNYFYCVKIEDVFNVRACVCERVSDLRNNNDCDVTVTMKIYAIVEYSVKLCTVVFI